MRQLACTVASRWYARSMSVLDPLMKSLVMLNLDSWPFYDNGIDEISQGSSTMARIDRERYKLSRRVAVVAPSHYHEPSYLCVNACPSSARISITA